MKTALTIGNFDGVHLGHQALVKRAREQVGAQGHVVALVFDPHPMAVLRPELEPARLMNHAQRVAALREAGADMVDRLEPTRDLLSMSPEAFIRAKVERYHPAGIVEGDDFHFGKGRAGTVKTLRELGTRLGFACEVVPPVEIALDDHQIVRASSTMARWLVSHGRVRDAARVLGRPYTIEGTVVRGDRRGRELDLPTANLETAQLLPADGVYAGWAVLPDGARFTAAVNVGTRPVFGGGARRMEVHVMRDTGGNEWAPLPGVPEYGWPLRVELIAWVRDDLMFDSAATMMHQISRDLARCRAELGAFEPSAAAGACTA
ncbi:MAG: riboflavin biosynthesis protein [Phycisphaerae bacterium]|nr:MAG: riboflavin biosynthesis protein [Phycisphaerae bacterium]